MTGKEIIKIIQDNGLEDFELKVSHLAYTDDKWGFELETLEIESLNDIGHSDRTATFNAY